MWQVLKGTVKSVIEDDSMGAAAQIAYHWVFSLFPGVFVLAAILSHLGSNQDLVADVYEALSQIAPHGTARLVRDALTAIGRPSGAGTAQVLTLGLLSMSWVASNGFAVIMGNLNRAYDIQETRPFVQRRLMAMALFFLVGFGLFLAFQIFVAGTGWMHRFLEVLPFASRWPDILRWGRWPLYSGLAFGVAALLYGLAPALPRIDWRWTLPGAFVFAVLWLTAGSLFDLYLSRYASMNQLYGAIGTFLAFLGWLYLTAFAFLIGGQVNGRIRCLHLDHLKRLQEETARAERATAAEAGEPAMADERGL